MKHNRKFDQIIILRICYQFTPLLLLLPFSTAFALLPTSHNNPIFSSKLSEIYLSKNERTNDGIGVGIDLGTTHSAIAFLHPETQLPTIIPIPNNGRTMPSVVTIQGSTVLVGKEAIEQEAQLGAYRNIKRILGRGAQAAQDSYDVVPFLATSSSTTANKKSKKFYSTKKKQSSLAQQLKEAQEYPARLYAQEHNNTTLMPAEISAHILRILIQTAEDYAGQKVTRAVIGVPAYFHDVQRDATIQAAQLAGVSKVKLLREPEAAALAYGIGKQQWTSIISDNESGEDDDDDNDELVLVFDLGGGTYDVSMLLVGGGLTEIITTSGDSQLGGSDFDARVAQHLRKVLAEHGLKLSSKKRNHDNNSCSATDAIVRSAEMIRIYLSNNRRVNLALPLDEESWSHMPHASDVILPLDFLPDDKPLSAEGTSNSTHVLCQLTRRDMERMCQEEFQALLRPLREVAIMAGALLPGDTSPTIVEAALELGEEDGDLAFEAFYKADDREETVLADDEVSADMLLQIDEISMKERKKSQQRGRRKARDVTKREWKYRQEKRKILEQAPVTETTDVKVRDGISGRPISRVVLVGGATRMPAIGRLLSAMTGVVPQKTVNPDEAVALGCAVHVGVLDGIEGMGTVLNPMQAAILRAVAEQRQQEGLLSDGFIEDDEDDFGTVELF